MKKMLITLMALVSVSTTAFAAGSKTIKINGSAARAIYADMSESLEEILRPAPESGAQGWIQQKLGNGIECDIFNSYYDSRKNSATCTITIRRGSSVSFENN